MHIHLPIVSILERRQETTRRGKKSDSKLTFPTWAQNVRKPLGHSSMVLFSIAYALHCSEQITTHILHGAHTQISPSLKCFTPRLSLHPQVLTAPSKHLLDSWISLHCYVTHVHNHTHKQTGISLTVGLWYSSVSFTSFFRFSGASSQGRRLCEGLRSLQSAWVYF